MDNILKTQFFDKPRLIERFDTENISDNLRQYGYAHVKNLLDEHLLEELHKEIKELDANEEMTPAAIGRGESHLVAKSIRSDKTKWLEFNSLTQRLLLDSLEKIRVQVNQNLLLGLFDIEAHYAVYRPGDFYKRHFDSFVGEKNRLLSMVLYLNKDWHIADGGLLNLYENAETTSPFVSIAPAWGECVLFLSEEVSHEVTVASRNRYSIAIWFHCRKPL